MSRHLIVHSAGPQVTVQDHGRPGFLAFGLSRGGAVDALALVEGATLLGQSTAALEMAGMGGEFETDADTRIALTGAPMRATIDGVAIAWNASHLLPAGARLRIGSVTAGSYGYLHLGGGIAGMPRLGSLGSHLAAGLGARLAAGDRIGLGPDPTPDHHGMILDPDDRFAGGLLRIVPSLQTAFFADQALRRFETTGFHRDTRGNRMGVRILPDGDGFQTDAGLSLVSEVVVPGDVQVPGDGVPFILLCECQTTGGYPRIGSVLPVDLPRVAQAGPGAAFRFQFLTLAEAVDLQRTEHQRRANLASKLRPLFRDPRDIGDLLSYQLISGAITGDEV